ncbi:hypothetical protein LTR08_000235 [Meristemomyces frigidus]|nr:hypothetical protein LTR08_000235 [Meristemomyces frigidus]
MPSINSIVVASLLALGAIAAPSHSHESRNGEEKRNGGYCLSNSQAQQIATNYGNLIAGYTKELADAALSPNFVDYSESVNSLINSCPQGSAAITLPLLSPSFSNRSQFELGQGQQAPINFQQLNLWHSCDAVIIRWETTNTANITDVKPVIGLITMETCKAPDGNQFPYYIDTVYSEFDAAAWLQNIQAAGFSAAAAAPTKPATKRRSKLAKENNITAEEEAEIQEAFNLFATPDASDESALTRHDVRRCLVALNTPPANPAEMVELLETVDPENTERVSYERFLAIAAMKLRARHDDPDTHDEDVARAYRLFTKGEARDITLNDLRRVARELREDVSDDVLKDMIREATGGGLGGVGAEDFEGVMKRAGVFA